MSGQSATEPDFPLESLAFEKAATQMNMRLDKLPGGFYREQATQQAWALWISRAAFACAGREQSQ